MNERDRDDLGQHYDTILRFVQHMGASLEDAEDITQTVFEQAALNPGRVRTHERPALAWLYTVARRRAIDHVRRETRRRRIEAQLSEPFSTDGFYGADVRATLRSALEALPMQQREVVVARLINDASFAEIAARLGTTEAACKMRFMRGLASIRAVLEQQGVDE